MDILFLIKIADQLDQDGQFDQADLIDENFEKFLRLLENGDLTFEEMFSSGPRNPKEPYSNRGAELPIFAIPGPQ